MATNRVFFYPKNFWLIPPLLISVHLPKTAGSSFQGALESYFGKRLSLDYASRPINQSSFERKASSLTAALQLARRHDHVDAGCIHGHFLPIKYRWLKTAPRKKFVVWLRDPIERLASHYYYWTSDYNPDTAGLLRRQVVEQSWDIERFCFSSEMRNIYTQWVWGFPMRRFDFVGITENYASDLNYFAKTILKSELPVTATNVNPLRPAERYIDDSGLRSRLEKFHQKDMRLYWRALEVSRRRQ